MTEDRNTLISPPRRSLVHQPLAKLFVMALLALTYCMTISVASASEPFFWRDSYGRGAGTATHLTCSGGKELDAGLCYSKCPKGYHGVGPVCWQNGVFFLFAKTHRRGVGTPASMGCDSDKELDAGLCYERCKTHYHGVGPVCWQDTPSNYVSCGAGFATSKLECAFIAGGQAMAAANFVGFILDPGSTEDEADANVAKEGGETEEDVSAAKRLLNKLESLKQEMSDAIEPTLEKGKPIAEAMKTARKTIVDYFGGEEGLEATRILERFFSHDVSQAVKLQQGPTSPYDWTRWAFTVTGMVDPTPVSDAIAAYTYPVFNPRIDYAKYDDNSGTATGPVTPHRIPAGDQIYTVMPNGNLRLYVRNSAGAIDSEGIIGRNWKIARDIAADTQDGLYVLGPFGNSLMYFRHGKGTTNWVINGATIASGFPALNKIFFRGAFVNVGGRGQETLKMHLYGVGEDGTLWCFTFIQTGDGAPALQKRQAVGSGWGNFTQTFANEAGLFGVTNQGRVRRYRYNYAFPGNANRPVGYDAGSGFNIVSHTFGGADGLIYAVTQNGMLATYQIAAGNFRSTISSLNVQGSGWNEARLLTAAKSRLHPIRSVLPGNGIYTLGAQNYIHLYEYHPSSGTITPMGRIGRVGGINGFAVGSYGGLYTYNDDYGLSLYYVPDFRDYQWAATGIPVDGQALNNLNHVYRIFYGGRIANEGGTRKARVLFVLTYSGTGTLWEARIAPYVQAGHRRYHAKLVNLGGGWNKYRRVFAGSNGNVYGVTSHGDLFRYHYDLTTPSTQTPQPTHVGTDWNMFTRIFGGTKGLIYGVKRNGTLYVYRNVNGAIHFLKTLNGGWAWNDGFMAGKSPIIVQSGNTTEPVNGSVPPLP